MEDPPKSYRSGRQEVMPTHMQILPLPNSGFNNGTTSNNDLAAADEVGVASMGMLSSRRSANGQDNAQMAQAQSLLQYME